MKHIERALAAERAAALECAQHTACEWCRRGIPIVIDNVCNANGWFFHRVDGIQRNCVAHPIAALPRDRSALDEAIQKALNYHLNKQFDSTVAETRINELLAQARAEQRERDAAKMDRLAERLEQGQGMSYRRAAAVIREHEDLP